MEVFVVSDDHVSETGRSNVVIGYARSTDNVDVRARERDVLSAYAVLRYGSTVTNGASGSALLACSAATSHKPRPSLVSINQALRIFSMDEPRIRITLAVYHRVKRRSARPFGCHSVSVRFPGTPILERRSVAASSSIHL